MVADVMGMGPAAGDGLIGTRASVSYLHPRELWLRAKIVAKTLAAILIILQVYYLSTGLALLTLAHPAPTAPAAKPHARPTAMEAPIVQGAPSRVGGTARVSGGHLTGPFAAQYTAAGHKYGVDPALLAAIGKAESNYNPRAVSKVGAIGLMQLMPGTARSLHVDPWQPDQAIDGAARLISGLLRKFGGRADYAIAAYNAGAGAVQRYHGVPPYRETQGYTVRVMGIWSAIKHKH